MTFCLKVVHLIFPDYILGTMQTSDEPLPGVFPEWLSDCLMCVFYTRSTILCIMFLLTDFMELSPS
jgi:hypothetical protein